MKYDRRHTHLGAHVDAETWCSQIVPLQCHQDDSVALQRQDTFGTWKDVVLPELHVATMSRGVRHRVTKVAHPRIVLGIFW